jgi:hypothetical protein
MATFPCDTTGQPFSSVLLIKRTIITRTSTLLYRCYELCTTSLSSPVHGCALTDVDCACNAVFVLFQVRTKSRRPQPVQIIRSADALAYSGLTDWSPSYTPAVCPASFFIFAGCSLAGQPGPRFTHYSCPTTFSDDTTTEFATLFSYISTAIETGSNSASKHQTTGSTKETGVSAVARGTATSANITIMAPSDIAKAGNSSPALFGRGPLHIAMPMFLAIAFGSGVLAVIL